MKTSSSPAQPRAFRPRAVRPVEKRRIAFWISIGAAAILSVALVVTLHYIFEPKVARPVLDVEFRDTVRTTNTATDIAIRPPHHWQIDDRREAYSLFIKCPGVPGFPPVIQIHTLPWAGKLAAVMDEQKARLKLEEPSIEFVKQEDDVLDGCPAIRLEYECDFKADEKSPTIKIHAMQYMLRDPGFPLFYKITCFATKNAFEEYRPLFDASLHTFRRLELKPVIPD